VQKHPLISLTDAQDVTDFFGGPALDVAQGDDFLLVGGEAIDGGLDAGAEFGDQQLLLGGRAPIAWLSDPAAGPFGIVFVELAGVDGGLAGIGLRIEQEVLARDGVLAMVSITGADRKIEIPADRINQGFVLGNKVALGSVNASREDFERAVLDLSEAELAYPGWLAKLLTHPVKGLANYAELMETLTMANGAIKVSCEVNGDMR
jgi:hypothetical protein